MNRQDFLTAAADCVCKSREEQYGSPEDVAVLMTLLKIARIADGNFKADSYVDAIGYLACGGEIAGRE